MEKYQREKANKIYRKLYRMHGRGLTRQYNYHGCGEYSVDFFLCGMHVGNWSI